jgi:hypothetical protein
VLVTNSTTSRWTKRQARRPRLLPLSLWLTATGVAVPAGTLVDR